MATPPIGVIKVNFDASVTQTKAATGSVIRDYFGKLRGPGGKLLLPLFVPYAALTTAWLGLLVACTEFQAYSIILEGDSASVVNWLNSTGRLHSSQHPSLLEIK